MSSLLMTQNLLQCLFPTQSVQGVCVIHAAGVGFATTLTLVAGVAYAIRDLLA